MKRIDAFEASDGTLFRSEQEALNHDQDVAIKNGILSWCGSSFCTNDNSMHEIQNAMMEDRDALRQILNGPEAKPLKVQTHEDRYNCRFVNHKGFNFKLPKGSDVLEVTLDGKGFIEKVLQINVSHLPALIKGLEAFKGIVP